MSVVEKETLHCQIIKHTLKFGTSIPVWLDGKGLNELKLVCLVVRDI